MPRRAKLVPLTRWLRTSPPPSGLGMMEEEVSSPPEPPPPPEPLSELERLTLEIARAKAAMVQTTAQLHQAWLGLSAHCKAHNVEFKAQTEAMQADVLAYQGHRDALFAHQTALRELLPHDDARLQHVAAFAMPDDCVTGEKLQAWGSFQAPFYYDWMKMAAAAFEACTACRTVVVPPLAPPPTLSHSPGGALSQEALQARQERHALEVVGSEEHEKGRVKKAAERLAEERAAAQAKAEEVDKKKQQEAQQQQQQVSSTTMTPTPPPQPPTQTASTRPTSPPSASSPGSDAQAQPVAQQPGHANTTATDNSTLGGEADASDNDDPRLLSDDDDDDEEKQDDDEQVEEDDLQRAGEVAADYSDADVYEEAVPPSAVVDPEPGTLLLVPVEAEDERSSNPLLGSMSPSLAPFQQPETTTAASSPPQDDAEGRTVMMTAANAPASLSLDHSPTPPPCDLPATPMASPPHESTSLLSAAADVLAPAHQLGLELQEEAHARPADLGADSFDDEMEEDNDEEQPHHSLDASDSFTESQVERFAAKFYEATLALPSETAFAPSRFDFGGGDLTPLTTPGGTPDVTPAASPRRQPLAAPPGIRSVLHGLSLWEETHEENKAADADESQGGRQARDEENKAADADESQGGRQARDEEASLGPEPDFVVTPEAIRTLEAKELARPQEQPQQPPPLAEPSSGDATGLATPLEEKLPTTNTREALTEASHVAINDPESATTTAARDDAPLLQPPFESPTKLTVVGSGGASGLQPLTTSPVAPLSIQEAVHQRSKSVTKSQLRKLTLPLLREMCQREKDLSAQGPKNELVERLYAFAHEL